MPQSDDSSTKQIPTIAEIQQSLSSLQVQDSPETAVMHSLPLSPPGDPHELQGTAAPLSPHHEDSLLTHPPMSPLSVLPTPPPSSETSPMMCTTGKGGVNHVTSADNTKGKGGFILL